MRSANTPRINSVRMACSRPSFYFLIPDHHHEKNRVQCSGAITFKALERISGLIGATVRERCKRCCASCKDVRKDVDRIGDVDLSIIGGVCRVLTGQYGIAEQVTEGCDPICQIDDSIVIGIPSDEQGSRDTRI